MTPYGRRDQNAALVGLFLHALVAGLGFMAGAITVDYVWRHIKWVS